MTVEKLIEMLKSVPSDYHVLLTVNGLDYIYAASIVVDERNDRKEVTIV